MVIAIKEIGSLALGHLSGNMAGLWFKYEEIYFAHTSRLPSLALH